MRPPQGPRTTRFGIPGFWDSGPTGPLGQKEGTPKGPRGRLLAVNEREEALFGVVLDVRLESAALEVLGDGFRSEVLREAGVRLAAFALRVFLDVPHDGGVVVEVGHSRSPLVGLDMITNTACATAGRDVRAVGGGRWVYFRDHGGIIFPRELHVNTFV